MTFADTEHLRAWLLCEVGHGISLEVPANAAAVWGIDGYSAFLCDLMREASARKYAFAFVDEARGVVTMKMPHSISWSALDQLAFAPVRNAVYEVIETRIVPGVRVKELRTAAPEDPQ